MTPTEPCAAQDSSTAFWRLTQARLTQQRERIIQEIEAYPAPIPACDVHFNTLLEEREHVSAALQKLSEAQRMGWGDAALDELAHTIA